MLALGAALRAKNAKGAKKRREAIVSAEVGFVRSARPELLISDIPFLAGDVAERTGIRCVGISNFSWDWIYDELFVGNSTYEPISRQIRDAYLKYAHLLELPFGRIGPKLPIQQVPLIAPQRRREPDEVLSQLQASTRLAPKSARQSLRRPSIDPPRRHGGTVLLI